ncbi:MAG: hypothetical protein VCB07_05480 [Gammaproteobacteria bacterium]
MKHMVVVLTEPTEGCIEEFNDYYENLHIDEVLATTGWKSGQRFELTDQVGAKCPLPYLAIYEAHTDDPKQVIQTLTETRPQRRQSTAINMRTAGVWIFSETGPLHEK